MHHYVFLLFNFLCSNHRVTFTGPSRNHFTRPLWTLFWTAGMKLGCEAKILSLVLGLLKL